MHFDGFYVSVYFATFSATYLQTLRDIDIDVLRSWKDKVRLNHTRLYNLFNTADRTEFIKEFVALLRFVASGEANIGFLGRNNSEVHRTTNDPGEVKDEPVLRPAQEELNEAEERMWRLSHIEDYTV